MYLLFRLLEAFVLGEISPNFFTEEYTTIYSFYYYFEGDITSIEKRSFNLYLNEKELEPLLDDLNELCHRYSENEETLALGYFIPLPELMEKSSRIYHEIKERELIKVASAFNPPLSSQK